MKKLFILIIPIISFIGAQTYCAGDQVSIADQNEEHLVGAGYGNYENGDIFKLADYNGDLNGGQYHVIFIDMSNSW
jgi:hypothetical protein